MTTIADLHTSAAAALTNIQQAKATKAQLEKELDALNDQIADLDRQKKELQTRLRHADTAIETSTRRYLYIAGTLLAEMPVWIEQNK